MNPLRKRFFGDTVVAQRYTGEAMGLLDAVYDQMRMNSLGQLTLHKTLGNGVEIRASSRFGQDEIQIHAVTPGGVSGAQGREYCVWEGDDEHFTPPIDGIAAFGPCTGANSEVVFGTWESGAGTFSTSFPLETSVSNIRTYKRTDISAALGPSFAIDSGIMPTIIIPSPVVGIGGITKAMFIVPSEDIATDTELIYTYFDDGGATGVYASTSATGPAIDRRNVHEGYSYKSVSYWVTGGSEAGQVNAFGTLASNTFVSGASAVLSATSTTASDWVVLTSKAFNAAATITRYAVGSNSPSSVYPNIPLDDSSIEDAWVVCQNDNTTLWLVAGRLTATDTGSVYSVKVYRAVNFQWQEVIPEGGWPALSLHLWFAETTDQHMSPILHDPVTDAVAVIKGDLSGAWIFNGKDCFGVGMAPFFRQFRQLPVDYTALDAQGDSFASEHSLVRFTQFYDAVLYSKFGTFTGFYNDNGLYTHRYVGASYKVGRLKQKKVSAVV